MVDISSGDVPIQYLWTAFGRRAAVAIGALTAFPSLLTDSPVKVCTVIGFPHGAPNN